VSVRLTPTTPYDGADVRQSPPRRSQPFYDARMHAGPRRTGALITLTALVAAAAGCGGKGDDRRAIDPQASVTVTAAAAPSAATAMKPQLASGPETADLFVQGTFTRGTTPVVGARVWVGIWPVDADDAKVGETIKAWTTQVDETDSQGHYAIHVDPAKLPARFIEAGGDGPFVNFDLMFIADGKYGQWSNPLQLIGHPTVWRTDFASRPTDSVIDVSADFQADTISVTDSSGEVTKSELPLGDASVP
jgi:hypothetical protein